MGKTRAVHLVKTLLNRMHLISVLDDVPSCPINIASDTFLSKVPKAKAQDQLQPVATDLTIRKRVTLFTYVRMLLP